MYVEPVHGGNDQQQHVYISYPYAFKHSALEIRDRLKDAGFKVWIDIDDMREYRTAYMIQITMSCCLLPAL